MHAASIDQLLDYNFASTGTHALYSVKPRHVTRDEAVKPVLFLLHQAIFSQNFTAHAGTTFSPLNMHRWQLCVPCLALPFVRFGSFPPICDEMTQALEY
jgi:hypothetical protein